MGGGQNCSTKKIERTAPYREDTPWLWRCEHHTLPGCQEHTKGGLKNHATRMNEEDPPFRESTSASRRYELQDHHYHHPRL